MKRINWKRVILTFLFLVLSIVGIVFLVKDNKKDLDIEKKEEPKEPVVEPVKKLQIIDEDSNSRPITVMINTHHDALPQSGLQDAYLVYEIMTEGGITRTMAVYKDAKTAKIGAIRSSRHYFLDYALENDAIYVHFGWSPYAEQDIYSLGINNVNGMVDSGFWRDTNLNRDYEHTAFTNIEKISKTAKNRGYRNTSDKDTLLKYSIDEIDLSLKEGAILANEVVIDYSYYHTTSYVYDEVNKVYKRSLSGIKNVDLVTNKQYTAKNIITYKVENYTLDKKGRQDLKNIGSGEGYYISNGYAVPITWEKKTREGQTVYRYLDGKEIVVNDGNTFIQIQPINQKLEIK